MLQEPKLVVNKSGSVVHHSIWLMLLCLKCGKYKSTENVMVNLKTDNTIRMYCKIICVILMPVVCGTDA